MYLEIQAHSLINAKRKEGVNYQIAVYGNGITYGQYFDITSLKPLTP